MVAISLWEPWATAIALDAKKIETRHWSTNYRGPLAIHAAKRMKKSELMELQACNNWRGVFMPLVIKAGGSANLIDLLNFGKIVAIVNLYDCKPTELFTGSLIDITRRPDGLKDDRYDWTERQLGDFSAGRFGWMLGNVRALKNPIPFKGKQGFFNVPDSLLTNV